MMKELLSSRRAERLPKRGLGQDGFHQFHTGLKCLTVSVRGGVVRCYAARTDAKARAYHPDCLFQLFDLESVGDSQTVFVGRHVRMRRVE